MQQCLRMDAFNIIEILLKFTTSEEREYQLTAYWALKDYILLTRDKDYIDDISDIITSFTIGVLNDDQSIQAECANAISFLVTHRLVYKSEIKPGMKEDQVSALIKQTLNSEESVILDAIMFLSGNESMSIRTTAFSTLSQLSKFCSSCESVMAQISRDIEIPSNVSRKDYLKFISERLEKKRVQFYARIQKKDFEQKYSGLFSLLRLAQQP